MIQARPNSIFAQTSAGTKVRAPRGIALVVVLLAIALLSLSGFTFQQLMFAEFKGTVASGRALQTRAAADSAIEMARTYAELPFIDLQQYGGLYENEALFRDALVQQGVVPADNLRFSISAPAQDNGYRMGLRYGLEDESSKLNLNVLVAADTFDPTLARQILTGLPGVSDDIADAILDWVDTDNTPRTNGAELDYYSTLSPAYAPKNGPIETIEELLLVRGVTKELLFGGDTNRNGVLDDAEMVDGGPPVIENSQGTVDNSQGFLDCGLAPYLTVYSAEANLRANGEPRIDLNKDDLKELHAELTAAFTEEWANFIILYRQNGAFRGNAVNAQNAAAQTINLERAGPMKLSTVLDLIGARVQLPAVDGQNVVVETPFPDFPGAMLLYLPLLMDNATINASPVIPGRVNINQAPRMILNALPGITQDVVEQIITVRVADPGEDRPGRRHETWLLAEGIVDLAQMKQLIPFITAGGRVYRAQIVASYEQGSAATRIEAIIDATATPSRLLFWRELNHLGRGF